MEVTVVAEVAAEVVVVAIVAVAAMVVVVVAVETADVEMVVVVTATILSTKQLGTICLGRNAKLLLRHVSVLVVQIVRM